MGGIAIITARALPARGGLARASSRIAGHAAAAGEPTHLIHLSRDAPPGARGLSSKDGVTVHPVGKLGAGKDSAGRDAAELDRAALFSHALDVVREHDLDVVMGLYATWPGHLAVLVAQAAGVASVVAIRGNDLDRGLFRAQDLPALERAARTCTVLTAVSRAHAELASKLFEREVRWVTNGVDTDRFLPTSVDNTLRAAVGLGSEDHAPVIGFSGELREKKGMRFLLPAFASVAARRPCSLLLIGGHRADADAAWRAFEKKAPEAAKRVVSVPWSHSPAHLSKMLGLCDVMVFPSLVEGTPNAVLEAMACGRPVLATAVGGHLDLIEHGQTGALLGLDELDRLPEAIEEMLDLDEGERRAMGTGARAHVEREHALEVEAQRWREIWAEARSRGSRPSTPSLSTPSKSQ